MLPRNHPYRIKIAFDDHRLMAIRRADSSGHPGPAPGSGVNWSTTHVEPGECAGAGEHGRQGDDTGSSVAGGDCIDDADVLRTGGTAGVGCTLKAPSTPRFREGRLWGPSCAALGARATSWIGFRELLSRAGRWCRTR